MTNFVLDRWDQGRVTVNTAFAETLRANGLTRFDTLMQFAGGSVAKNLLRERTTTRIELPADNGRMQAFFLKRHGPPPWKEYVKPWLRLTRPILGARNEWQAILAFHQAGIPTMVPAALGEAGRHSFLLTQSIEGCRKLSHWMEQDLREDGADGARLKALFLHSIARTARRMHAARMHHQDFYLTHLLVPADDPTRELFVIDLGRVRRRRRLGQRWIVKDLAQLNYSAPQLTQGDRRQFLADYLGRPLSESDRPLLRRIERKTAAIARHSRKNKL